MQVFYLKNSHYSQCLFQVLGSSLCSSFNSLFLPKLLLMSFLAAILKQFWKCFIQFLCFSSGVLTYSLNPRNFSPFCLHQPSLQNNVELAPRHRDSTTCCHLGEFTGKIIPGLRPVGWVQLLCRTDRIFINILSRTLCQVSQLQSCDFFQQLCRGIVVISEWCFFDS